jgi:hypothetical protein
VKKDNLIFLLNNNYLNKKYLIKWELNFFSLIMIKIIKLLIDKNDFLYKYFFFFRYWNGEKWAYNDKRWNIKGSSIKWELV